MLKHSVKGVVINNMGLRSDDTDIFGSETELPGARSCQSAAMSRLVFQFFKGVDILGIAFCLHSDRLQLFTQALTVRFSMSRVMDLVLLLRTVVWSCSSRRQAVACFVEQISIARMLFELLIQTYLTVQNRSALTRRRCNIDMANFYGSSSIGCGCLLLKAMT